MACDEIAALRLALMNVLGGNRSAERQHEEAEIGQALLREGVSIRDLGVIVEAIGDKARLTRDPALLAEYARQALGRTIVAPFLDAEGSLKVIALDPQTEQAMAEARAALDRAEAQANWSEGYSLVLEDMLTEALTPGD